MGLVSGLRRLFGSAASAAGGDENDGWDNGVLGLRSTTIRSGTPMSGKLQQALTISTVWRGVSIVANTVGRMPIRVRRELPTGGYETVQGHHVRRLTRRPNPYQTGFRFFSMLLGHLVLRGNGYARIESDATEFAARLIPVHPDRVQPYDVVGNEVIYKVTPPFGVGRKPVEYLRGGTDIIHFRGLTDDGIVGLSVFDLMRRQTETVTNMEEYGRALFTRFPMLRGIVQYPGKFSDQRREEFQRSFRKMAAGRANWGGIRVLDRGMEWKSIGLTNEQSQWLESRQFAVPEFARWLGIPTALLMHTDKTSLYANVDRLLQAWGSFDLAHWLTNIEQELGDVVLTTAELDDGLSLDFDDAYVLRGAPADRAKFYQTMIASGVLTANECRAMERLAPLSEEEQARQAMAMNPQPPAEDDDDEKDAKDEDDEDDDDDEKKSSASDDELRLL